MKNKNDISQKKFYHLSLPIAGSMMLLGLFLGGCQAKDSGLYQVTAGEALPTDSASAEEVEKTDTEEPAEGTDAAGLSEEGQYEPAQTVASDQNAAALPESGEAEEDSNQTIFVHVCGAVNDPGVYELEPDVRIIDAIEAAGGFTEEACEDYVNLAEKASDGMKINIPTLEEAKELGNADEIGVSGETGHAPSADQSGGTAASASSNSGNKVNINTADSDELCTISGIGPTKAAAIITYRETVGSFASIEEIKNVNGIGDGTYSKLKDEITTGNE